MLIAILEDDVFRKKEKEPYAKRWTVRAFARNKKGQFAFLRIKGIDGFGQRNHLESVGGGIEWKEEMDDAIKREIKEEIGYECKIERHIGYIVDHYNLINRETISNYFVVELTKYVGGEQRTTEEKKLIQDVEYFDEDEVLDRLKNCSKRTVNELVQRRDAIAFRAYLKGKKD